MTRAERPPDRGQPPLVTFDLWTVAGHGVPGAVLRMALDRAHLRRTPGLTFAKLLGTGDGRTFTVRDANLRRWALLCVWNDAPSAQAFEQSATTRAWNRLATQRWRTDLRPLSSRGRWSRRQPFGFDDPSARHPTPAETSWSGPVAAVTRARLAPRRALSFWRAVPPVSADLATCPGLRFALGIGEAPVGLQGTFSLWEDARSLRSFAYERAAHTAVVRRTSEEGWYTEELFARFAVVGARGTVDGREPLTQPDPKPSGRGGPSPEPG
ncbi:MAG: monooxygenase [Frankia sp.]